MPRSNGGLVRAQTPRLPAQPIPSISGTRWMIGATGATSNTHGNNMLRVSPVYLPSPQTWTQLGAEVTAAGDAGSTLTLLVYRDTGQGFPGGLLANVGAINGATVAVQTVAANLTLPAGYYWIGALLQGAPTTQPTFRSAAGPVVATPAPAGTAPFSGTSGLALGVSGSPPDPFPSSGWSSSSPIARVFGDIA